MTRPKSPVFSRSALLVGPQGLAEVVPPPTDTSHVRFGAEVTFEREDGRQQTYRIVGEDEADPQGQPLLRLTSAQALMGKEVGDTVTVGQGQAEIISIRA